MTISISTRFDFRLDAPTDLILQFEAAAIPEQAIRSARTSMTCGDDCVRVPAHEAIGERILVHAEGRFEVAYEATVDVNRLAPELAGLEQLAPHDLPGDPLEYLLDSRYCPADRLQSFAEDEFGGTSGGDRIVAIHDWIAQHFTYEPGSSTPTTTALDSFVERRGICRDYAHVLITLARASTIPARYVSCFAPGVEPPDFHAVAEVFLADRTTPGGGAWYIVDATGMATPGETVKIGVGRDAADVSFLTSFGPSHFGDKSVTVTRAG
ncbi:transglutaminase family protein [Tsuneonella sp. YG55]|uniref:Transglutaminase family protein n=1 Tax=Tsuneonella litorea TaxID=2976475 RepID=A0A9X3ALA2_9SPHN|nr:transglutaminase family protein [Tsuneonella litorea]MCT2559489.1 transglutaminase family protein [Tsuneonella litorea]